MFWADHIGLDTVVAGLEVHRDKLDEKFSLSRLLTVKAVEGGGFGA